MTANQAGDDSLQDTFSADTDDEFESLADYHRAAAQHFTAAARHHLAAATADDEGNDAAVERHTYKAYRHQLAGTQYAEVAVMEFESADDQDEDDLEV
jgi:hypothetical protein